MNYERLLSFGDILELNIQCDPYKLLKETKSYKWMTYNPRKDIKRYGLSLTSLTGKIDGIDLDSIYEYNRVNNTSLDETSFTELTDVYYNSSEVRKIMDPWIDTGLGRSHIIHLPPGGHFPPHRDLSHFEEDQKTFRVVVPLINCNPEQAYFMYEDKPLHFKHGKSYFMNTNKMHSVFSMSDCYLIVLNVFYNDDNVKEILSSLAYN